MGFTKKKSIKFGFILYNLYKTSGKCMKPATIKCFFKFFFTKSEPKPYFPNPLPPPKLNSQHTAQCTLRTAPARAKAPASAPVHS